VDLFRRSAARIRGSISGARLDDGSGGSAAATSILVDGPANAAATTIVVDPAAVRAAIVSAAARQFGISITDARLVPPDRLHVVTSVGSIDGRVRIDPAGALAFDTRLGTVPILTIEPSLPLRLRSVAVVDGALRLDGILNAQVLLGG